MCIDLFLEITMHVLILPTTPVTKISIYTKVIGITIKRGSRFGPYSAKIYESVNEYWTPCKWLDWFVVAVKLLSSARISAIVWFVLSRENAILICLCCVLLCYVMFCCRLIFIICLHMHTARLNEHPSIYFSFVLSITICLGVLSLLLFEWCVCHCICRRHWRHSTPKCCICGSVTNSSLLPLTIWSSKANILTDVSTTKKSEKTWIFTPRHKYTYKLVFLSLFFIIFFAHFFLYK